MSRRFLDITAEFARWFGRSLRWWERNIIFTLERQRRRRGGINVQVVDYPDTDSTEVLIGYINWLMTLTPELDLVLVDRSIKEAHALEYKFVRRPLAIASQRRPNALRGTNFNILYAHDLNRKKAQELFRYAHPVFLDLPCYIIIYHSCAGTRNPDFPPCVERDISISAYRAYRRKAMEDLPAKAAPMTTVFLIPVSSPPKPPPKERRRGLTMETPIFYTFAAAAPHTTDFTVSTSQRRVA